MKKLNALTENISVLNTDDQENLKGGWVCTCEEKRKTWTYAGKEYSYTYMEWRWIDDGLARTVVIM